MHRPPPANDHQSYWPIFSLNLKRIPWKDYLTGLFAPIFILQVFGTFGKSLLGVEISLVWLAIVIAISLVTTRGVSLFPIISLLMLVTQTAAGMLEPTHRVFLLIPSWDNGLLGLAFIGSLLSSRPLVLSLVNKETVSRLSAKYGKSSYYLKAWERITIVWGLFYVFQSMVVSATSLVHSSFGRGLDILFSWPTVLLLLYFSVDYPRVYWEKHADDMRRDLG